MVTSQNQIYKIGEEKSKRHEYRISGLVPERLRSLLLKPDEEYPPFSSTVVAKSPQEARRIFASEKKLTPIEAALLEIEEDPKLSSRQNYVGNSN